jgi:hypothetical protein
MKIRNLVALAAVVASLSSCVLNEQTFNSHRVALRHRPDIVAQARAKCESRVRYARIEAKRYMAGFMHTEIDGLPQKVCGRMQRAYLSGRMRYQDFKALISGQKFTPNMIAILRAG